MISERKYMKRKKNRSPLNKNVSLRKRNRNTLHPLKNTPNAIDTDTVTQSLIMIFHREVFFCVHLCHDLSLATEPLASISSTITLKCISKVNDEHESKFDCSFVVRFFGSHFKFVNIKKNCCFVSIQFVFSFLRNPSSCQYIFSSEHFKSVEHTYLPRKCVERMKPILIFKFL